LFAPLRKGNESRGFRRLADTQSRRLVRLYAARRFLGTASFTYIAGDASQSSAPATVQINVVDPHAPTGRSDFYDVLHDSTLHVAGPGALGNDADADGDPISAAVRTGPQHGSLTLRADGSFDYIPVAGFVGDDSFSYQVGDGALTSAPVSVTLLVHDVAPTALGDSYRVREDTTLHVAAPGVTGNDSDADIDAPRAALVGGPAHGTLVFHADGSFDYTPAANYSGPDSFTYKVNDGALDSNTATVNLAITPVNDAPAGADRTVTALEDTAFTLGVPDFGFHDPYDTPANALRAVEITTLLTVNVTAAMMVGDAAADTFVFHQKFGSNEVKGFDLDHDFLQFDRGMFAGDTAAAVLAAAHDQKGGVVIDAHAGHLVIDNVTLAQLQAHANDFLFV
jgi:VCBS repeat-containing protein